MPALTVTCFSPSHGCLLGRAAISQSLGSGHTLGGHDLEGINSPAGTDTLRTHSSLQRSSGLDDTCISTRHRAERTPARLVTR